MPAHETHAPISSSSELRGKVAVVTGATGGIGRAITLELAAAGAQVVVHGRDNVRAAEQLTRDLAACGADATVILCDLSDPPARASLVEQAWKWRDGFHIWINNAGADVLTGDAAGWPFERKLAWLWRVDVEATIVLARLAGQRIREAVGDTGDAGVVLNIGWDQAELGMAGDSGEMFAAVKGAIMAFSKSLAKSLAPQVRVNCIAPGWIKTAWGDQASDYWQQRAVRESLLERWGTPEDVARVARFLCSPAASYLTGQVIAVNGGFRHVAP